MRKVILAGFYLLFGYALVFAQKQKCLTAVLYQEAIEKDSTFLINRARIQKQLSQFEVANRFSNKTAASVRVIPVVFHIIHEGGPENISKAQIDDQIKILNADYRRLNADASNTPGPFANVAADCNIEFRLAQKDPNAQCTQGIVRVYSAQTNNARDNIKSLSYWPSSNYLNIWVVKSIKSNSTGTILGYAQLPGGNALTDGVVLRSDVIGTIETAANSFGKNEAGRTATHEIGHWFDLLHIWGDDDGACTGTDFVDDTPNQANNSDLCPTFPKTDACTPSGNGIMFMNYMDYSNGMCMNLFTQGQKLRMDGTLSVSRANISSDQNLINTGTDGTPAALCAPIPWFQISNTMICPGNPINFIDQSYNGAVATWSWFFPGGTPGSSNVQSPIVIYNTPGKYDVTLTISNAAGSNTLTRQEVITISSPTSNYTAPYAEAFEMTSFPGTDWKIINEDEGKTWERSTSITTNRDGRIGIENFEANIPQLKDVIISPSIDLTGIVNPTLTFNVAYAQTTSASSDKLSVYLSKDCGQSWDFPIYSINPQIPSYAKSGANLATAGIVTSPFYPNPQQWRKEVLPLSYRLNKGAGAKDNVRFKFEFENGGGNNIFIDDINVGEPVNIAAKDANLNLSFFPNPSHKDVFLAFNLFRQAVVKINIFDALGKELPAFDAQNLSPGEQRYQIATIEHKGVYFVKVTIDKDVELKKLVIY